MGVLPFVREKIPPTSPAPALPAGAALPARPPAPAAAAASPPVLTATARGGWGGDARVSAAEHEVRHRQNKHSRGVRRGGAQSRGV